MRKTADGMNEQEKTAMELRIAADQCIDQMTEPENLAAFLEIVVQCPSQPYENQLLLWRQFPSASDVAGIRRWRLSERTIREDERPIWILLPYLRYVSGTGKAVRRDDGMLLLDAQGAPLYEQDPVYESGFVPAAVFDISQTQGGKKAEEKPRKPEEIEEALRSLSITISEEKTDELPRDLPDGYASDSIFHISKALRDTGNRYYCVLLKLFAAWVIGSMREPGSPEEALEHGDIITAVCAFCIQAWYFGRGTEVRPALVAAKLSTFSHKERREILKNVSRYHYRILQYLTAPELGFTDTAVVNGMLDTGNVADISAALNRVQEAAELDEEISLSVTGLMDKLICASRGFPGELYRKKLFDKVILSSPPVVVPTRR